MTKNNFINRTSVKHFSDKQIPKKDIQKIIKIINNSPTSMNHQQFSAIIINNTKIKNMIGTNNFNQQHIKDSAIFILFLADRTRIQTIMNENNLKFNKKFQTLEIIRTITDAVIAATYAQDALIEMGYGTSMIGGILSFIEKLNKELNIPKTAIPVLGIAVGIASKTSQIKPKMNKVFINKYNPTQTLKEQKKYSNSSKNYFKNIGEKEFAKGITKMMQLQTHSKNYKKINKSIKKALKNLFTNT